MKIAYKRGGLGSSFTRRLQKRSRAHMVLTLLHLHSCTDKVHHKQRGCHAYTSQTCHKALNFLPDPTKKYSKSTAAPMKKKHVRFTVNVHFTSEVDLREIEQCQGPVNTEGIAISQQPLALDVSV